VIVDDEEQDLWMWDMSRATLMRTSFGPARELFPLWTPDGRRIIFGSGAGARSIYWRSADGTGVVERLTESRYSQNPTAITPDGRFVVLTEQVPDGGDVMQLALSPEGLSTGPAVATGGRSVAMRAVTPLVRSRYIERNAALSPDGRWLAYEANESGEFEVYVRPYPDVDNGRWQVSTDGGTRPVWAKSSAELFWVSPTGSVMRVGVERAASWATTTPAVVIEPGYLTNPTGSFGAMFDVALEGRFVMVKERQATPETAPPVSVVVVQHWAEELKRLAPAGR
jgi:Tol biopolymer transport system component